MNTRTLALPLLLSALFALIGCAGTQKLPPRPATINHFVVFKLNDPAQTGELIRDCDELLGTIPVLTSYFAGRHHDVGRGHVFSDYDVGLFVGFDSDADYATYVDHPNHIRLVEKWRPRMDWMRVYDVYDDGIR